MNSKEVLDLLEWSGAILKGHFKLTSGRHSNRYIEKFRLLENPIALDKICSAMANIYKEQNVDLVASAAIGGILIAGGVGRHLNTKHIFSERVDGNMVLKRGFTIEKRQNILIVEDIVTTGGSIFELIKIVKSYNAELVGITSILDRNKEPIDFRFSYKPLVQYPIDSWNTDQCPQCVNGINLTSRGRSGKKI